MYTAAAAGGYGVGANAYEIWEYPNNATTDNCCRQRFVIKPSIGGDGSQQSVVIDAQGRMSIGGTQGSHHLSVNGSICAKEIKVETGWADYVFDSDYKLRSLSEVKQHIAENKHLPGISTEAEVTETGMNLGEM